ncbi:flagella basal body P-ring formation protein FlgA [Sphingomonas sp. S1-29]|uniref:flagella basal body P-ring formation protein FlgA n=1 Tax=Sphingomonas sp. S1-29 TaxID=2991074 RepID=UPI00223F570B|nr:flagella basal body P-ring formation protein FlgA [Sphingomonas sp. S1-29]UZK68894.1 flagella basal body P-ring formation protein FlgA [Sphingomonas sp. S1-29]
MIRLLIPALLIAAPAAAQQRSFQDTALLDTAVAQFTGAAIGSDGGAVAAIDRRLKLAPCAMPQFEWRSPAQDTVVIRCMAPVWRIYVPVIAEPKASAPILAAAAPVTPALKPEIVVKRGDPVMVKAGSAGFSITRDGVAMGDAAAGARLMVKVDPKKPPIQAVAVEAGRVTLPGWAE